MKAIAIILLCTGISLTISAFVIMYISNQILKLFETQDKYNEMIIKHINNIYDVIIFNGLAKPNKKDKEV